MLVADDADGIYIKTERGKREGMSEKEICREHTHVSSGIAAVGL